VPVRGPYVFVHGLFGPLNDPAMFAALAPAEVSAPDLVGYGARTGGEVTLAGQVAALRAHVEDRHRGERVVLVGHSIGAVYAFALADQAPDLVSSVVSVEGNFSLADAFWSASIAATSADAARSSIDERLSDPAGFLDADGISARRPWLDRAVEALAYQPWQTVRASAVAIVEATSRPEYERLLQRVFARHPVHLVSGERSRAGWHVPAWAAAAAASDDVMAGVGHMMALEDPARFGTLIATLD